MKQNTSTVLMVSPTRFGFNEEAFLTNSFQNRPTQDQDYVQQEAKLEFDNFVSQLKKLDVDVIVYEDQPDSTTPDSIFPNNWFSTHANGKMILYPMAVSNRREERREYIINDLKDKYGYQIVDLTHFEDNSPALYLEGTGSLILDHENKIAFAAISPRTNKTVLESFSKELGYEPVSFNALGKTGELIYHTNVMMCVGDKYIIVGLDTVTEDDRTQLKRAIAKTGKEIIELTNEQVYDHFAGNMLQIKNKSDETILVMSQKALNELTEHQLTKLKALNDHILALEIPTIESVGGGSVRCMLAEIYPKV